MNPFKYLTNRSQILVVDAVKKEPSFMRRAESEALQLTFKVSYFLFQTFWVLTSLLFLPKIIIGYFMVLTGLTKTPAPALDLLNAQFQSRNKKMANKVGMNERKAPNEFN